MNANNKFKTKMIAMLTAAFMVFSFCYTTGFPLYSNNAIINVANAASIATGKVVNSTSVAVRKSNSDSSTKLGTLAVNSLVVVLDSSQSWYKIVYENQKGYVLGKYIQLQSSVKPTLKGIVNVNSTSFLNVRNSPSTTSGTILGKLYRNDTVDIVEEKEVSTNKFWYKIVYPRASSGYAWVFASYVNLKGTSFVTPTTTTTKSTTKTTVQTTTAATKPTTTTTKVTTTTTKPTTTTTKTTKTTTTTKPTTTKVTTQSTTNKTSLTASAIQGLTGIKKGIVNQNSVSVKESMSLNSKTITVLKKNTSVVILDHSGKWYKIKCGNKIGYVQERFVKESLVNVTTIKIPVTTTTTTKSTTKTTVQTTTTTKPTTTTTKVTTTTTKPTTTTTKTTKTTTTTKATTSVTTKSTSSAQSTTQSTVTSTVTGVTRTVVVVPPTYWGNLPTSQTTTTTSKKTTTTTKATQAQKTDYGISFSNSGGVALTSYKTSSSLFTKWRNSDVSAQGSLFGADYVLIKNSYGTCSIACSNSALSKNIVVKSSNASVLSVDEIANNNPDDGVVFKANGTGKATITASIPNNTKTFSFTVAVVTEDQVISKYESEAMRLINNYRAEAGVPALIEVSDLKVTAEIRSSECMQKFEKAFAEGQTEFSNTFAHTRLDGSPYARAFPASYLTGDWLVNENVAVGYEFPVIMCRSWYNSSGHRTTMLSTHYDRGYVGLSISDNGTFYWVLDAAGPSNATL